MKDIKFRAFDTLNKEMFGLEGFHVIGEVTMFGIIEDWMRENPNGGKGSLDRYGDIELMQFTGLKDSKGVEIYEGDIIRVLRTPDNPMSGYFDITAAKQDYEYRIAELEIKENDWENSISFSLPKSISYSERIEKNKLKWEVVGNKYQNPDLLKLVVPFVAEWTKKFAKK